MAADSDIVGRLREAEANARAWEQNYDGMFARWAECDAERLALKAELETANLRLRIQDEDRERAALNPPPGCCPHCNHGPGFVHHVGCDAGCAT